MQPDTQINFSEQKCQKIAIQQEDLSEIRNIDTSVGTDNNLNDTESFHMQSIQQTKNEDKIEPMEQIKVSKLGIFCRSFLFFCLCFCLIVTVLYFFNNNKAVKQQKQAIEFDENVSVNQNKEASLNNKQDIKRITFNKNDENITLAKIDEENRQRQTQNNSEVKTILFNSSNVLNQENSIQNMLIFLNRLKNAGKYHDIWKVTNYPQLPFCIFGPLVISASISSQNYSNYVLLPLQPTLSKTVQMCEKYCLQNSIVIFLKEPMENPNFLNNMNEKHQFYDVWATYLKINHTYEVVSVYTRILELCLTNDFEQKHRIFFDGKLMQQYLGLVIIQLSELHLYQLDAKDIGNAKFHLSFNTDSWSEKTDYLKIAPYNRIYKLAQDYPINQQIEQQRYSTLSTLTFVPYSQLNPRKMYKAIQRQQMLYLPKNHSLFKIECIESKCHENLAKNEVPFCVTVLSHDNINQTRYKKVMQSIFQQNYTNYRIIFIDDFSTDQNMEFTIKFVNESGFPKERIIYVQNTQRKFATYNIINAAFTYCKPEEIQLLIDGDDEIIGTQAFQILSNVYHKNPSKWIVYSNFKGNLYTYGTSKLIKKINVLVFNNKRRRAHYIGPIRTWRVQLLYHIPLKYHYNSKGKWLDTVYDDALQHSIVELAGLNRIQYVPEILYEYNMMYGDNDNSNDQKRKNRKESYTWVVGLKPLKMITSLEGSVKDKQIAEIFDRQKNVKFYEKK